MKVTIKTTWPNKEEHLKQNDDPSAIFDGQGVVIFITEPTLPSKTSWEAWVRLNRTELHWLVKEWEDYQAGAAEQVKEMHASNEVFKQCFEKGNSDFLWAELKKVSWNSNYGKMIRFILQERLRGDFRHEG